MEDLMNWVKKTGFSLMLFLSLGFAMPSQAMGGWWNAPDKFAAFGEALKQIGLSEDTIKTLLDLISRLEKSSLEVIGQLNTGLQETIQGSSELKALTTVQTKIETLTQNIQDHKAKSVIAPLTKLNKEKETKRGVAEQVETKTQAAQLSLTPESNPVEDEQKFIAEQVQPVVKEIEKILKELRSNIQQRILDQALKSKTKSESEADVKEKTAAAQTATQEKPKEISPEVAVLSSLREKEKSLEKILAQLDITKKLISSETRSSLIISILPTLIGELTKLNKAIDTEITHFKGGLAGVLNDTIENLTKGLSAAGKGISTNIGDDLQRNLRAALGSSEIIKIIEKIQTWLNDYDSRVPEKVKRRLPNKLINHNGHPFIDQITSHVDELETIICNLNLQNIPQTLYDNLFAIHGNFRQALIRYQVATEQAELDEKGIIAANQALYEAICRHKMELLDCLQGTLANSIHEIKKNLFDTVDRFNAGFGRSTGELNETIDRNMKIFKNSCTQLNTTINTTVNKDLPRTLKKGIGYLTLGTIAACAVAHIIWHDRPWQGHLKNIGIASGSLLCMFLVDPIIDCLYPQTPARRAA